MRNWTTKVGNKSCVGLTCKIGCGRCSCKPKKKQKIKKEKIASKKFTRNLYSFETNEIICIRRTLRCSLYSTYILDRFVCFGGNFSIKAPCIDGSDTTEAHLGHHIQKNRLHLMKNPTAEHLSTC